MAEQAHSRTILLVEDEVPIGEILSIALQEAGFTVVSADTDDAAFAALESEDCDLAGLVTDVNLRRTRSGWDVATRARELNPNLPVIYMSGADGQDWTSKGVPNSTLIAKPFVPAQVVVALAMLMNKTDAEG